MSSNKINKVDANLVIVECTNEENFYAVRKLMSKKEPSILNYSWYDKDAENCLRIGCFIHYVFGNYGRGSRGFYESKGYGAQIIRDTEYLNIEVGILDE